MKRDLSIIPAFFVLVAGISCNSNVATEERIESLVSKLDSCQAIQQEEEANKKLVADMYQEIFGDKSIDAADKYIVENYIQHNPSVADGRQALKTALSQWFANAPKEKIDIQRMAADGDLVFLHVRSKRGDKTVSVIDIFRVENGKITEHWDVIQEVPGQAANDHPMF